MGGGTLDGRADQYALACLFFECLSGHVPFARESDVAAMWAHVNESPPALSAARPGLPPALDAVLARALAKEPGGRYESCGAFVAAARHHLGGAAPGPVGAAGSAQGPARGTSGAAGLARGPARGAPGAGAPGAATAPARLQAGSSPAELAQSLRAHVRASAGLMAAGVAGVLATVAVLLVALAIAVVFPDESLVGLVGTEAGLVSETLRQAVGFLLWALTGVLAIALTQKELFGRPQGDAVFVTMPLGGAALGALGGLLAAQRRRTGHAGHPGAASPVAAPVSPPPPMAPVGQPAPPPPPRAPAGQPASPPPAATAPSPAPVEEPTRVAPPARDAPTVLEPPSGAPTRQRPEGPHPPG